MTALNFAPTYNEQLAEKFTALLDEAIEAQRGESELRDYLGGSRLGEECSRKLFYEYTHAAPDEGRGFGGKSLRIFDMGHDAEERMAGYMRKAGFHLITHRPDGSQLGFAIARDPTVPERYRIRGHIDGVIVDGPDLSAFGVRYPCLWENKALGNKTWTKTKTSGLRTANAVYYAQVNIYMAYMDLTDNSALWTAINRDTGDILPEPIPFDAGCAQEASDRGVRVVSAAQAHELPRIASERTFFQCKWCAYQDRCWSEIDPAVQGGVAFAEPPAWFGQGAAR